MGQASSLLLGGRREAERQRAEAEAASSATLTAEHSATGQASLPGPIASGPLTYHLERQQQQQSASQSEDVAMSSDTSTQPSYANSSGDSMLADNVGRIATEVTPATILGLHSRPTNNRMQSISSSNGSSNGTIRPHSHSRTSSARSIATITSSTTSGNQDTDTDMTRSDAQMKRRSFIEKLRNRRLPSYSRSLRDSSPSTFPEESDSLQSHSPSRSLQEPLSYASLQQPAYVPGAMPVTPPEELDAMFEERQRARQLIDNALAQARAELEHRVPASTSGEQHNIVIRAPNEEDALDPPAQVIPIMASPSLQSSDSMLPTFEQDVPPQHEDVMHSFQDRASRVASPIVSHSPPRPISPLPRRVSRSPSPVAHTMPLIADSALPTSSSTPSASNTHNATTTSPFEAAPSVQPQATSPAPAPVSNRPVPLPRRILVQGIVAQSPPRTPTSSRPSTPNVVVPSRSRASSQRAVSRHSQDLDSSTPGDSGFWGELPGSESLSDEDRSEDSHSDRSRHSGSGGDAWDDAVAELLSLPYEEPYRREEQGSSEEEEADDSSADYPGLGSPSQQGALIGRLLSIAAAATAATLLPAGSITVNGQAISGFDDGDSGMMSAAGAVSNATSTPRPPPRARSSSLSAIHVRPRRATSLGNSASSPSSGGNDGPPASPRRQGSGSLQGILRDALAAAFRTPPTSPPVTSPAATSPTVSSPLMSPTLLSSPLLNSNPSTEPALPASDPQTSPGVTTTSPLAQQPSIPDSSASAASLPDTTSSPTPTSPTPAALFIPSAALQADPQLTYGSTQPPGTFERFLADLQTDVSSAIVRYQGEIETARLTRPESSVATQTDTPASPASSQSTSDTPALLGATNSASPVRVPGRFAFFRAYRFPAQRVDSITPASAGSGIPVPTPAPSSAVAQEDSQNTDTPAVSASSEAEVIAPPPEISEAVNVSPGSANTPAGSTSPANAPGATFGPETVPANAEIVPMLLVGVRSMTRPLAEEVAEATREDSTASPEEENVDPAMIPLPTDDDGDTIMSEAEASAPSVDPAVPQAASQAPAIGSTAAPESTAAPTAGFVLWIMGGLYPSNHPIVIAPNLLSEEALSYEDMLRLAEVMGQHKPATVSKEEIAKSDLQVIKGDKVLEYVEAGDVLPITAERCLVCLEDYEAEEDVRILQCKHCFHQPCVDKWLSQGANTCPACRTTGIKKEESIAEAAPATTNQQEETPPVASSA